MMDEKIINDLTNALVALRSAPDVDHDYFKGEVKYILRLAWRTGVLDNIKDIREQAEQQLKEMKRGQS